MMIITGLLTAILVIDCLFLILLVLVQLPKKEAGAGMAFGGAATDALFGAGSGTALTKITKYCAIIFFVLALVLSVMSGSLRKGGNSNIQELLKDKAGKTMPGAPTSAQPSTGTPAVQNSQVTTPTTPAISTAPTETPAATVTPAPAPVAPAATPESPK